MPVPDDALVSAPSLQVIFQGPQGSPVQCKVVDLSLAEFKSLVCGDGVDSEGRSTPRYTPTLTHSFCVTSIRVCMIA